jgi:predicted transcriptional regulator
LNIKVKEAAEKLAEGELKTFVISDSEESELKKRLEGAKITWPLLSKYDIRDSILEVVIDNLSEEEFRKIYDITPQRFIQVGELIA